MSKETKFTKTQGHHCWWLNIHGESVANFNHEIDVNDLVMAGNMMPKLYALLERYHSESRFVYGEDYDEVEDLLAEARGVGQ